MTYTQVDSSRLSDNQVIKLYEATNDLLRRHPDDEHTHNLRRAGRLYASDLSRRGIDVLTLQPLRKLA